MKTSRRRTTVASCMLALSVVVLLAFGVGSSSALGNGYTSVVFADGFESGNLSNRNGLIFFPYSATGSTEIFTGSGSMPVNTWTQVEVQYTASATGGGAQLYVNGQTQAGWGVTGNYTRSANLQRLQLWNDGPAAV